MKLDGLSYVVLCFLRRRAGGNAPGRSETYAEKLKLIADLGSPVNGRFRDGYLIHS